MTDVLDRHGRLVHEVAGRLAGAGVDSPDVDARRIVEHVTTVAGAPSGDGRPLLEDLVARRVAREPLQLVIGHTWFRELELVCAPGVFVPRPETEIVAGAAIESVRRRRTALVLEPCTGTGAIALSVAVSVPGVRVVAGDIDPAAVALTRRNVARAAEGGAGVPGLAAGARVEVLGSDLLDGIDPALAGAVDVLVANPPYLPAADRGSWPPEVADHDPDRALVGGPDGHEVVDALLGASVHWLAAGGTVVLEIDQRRSADAVRAASKVGLEQVRVVADLTGADRAIVARRPE